MPRRTKGQVVQAETGVWYDVGAFTHEVCCDCSLVHKIETRIHNGRLQVSWTRDDDATAKLRAKQAQRRAPRKRA